MNTVKNIIFDFGGVLLPIDYDKVSDGFKKMSAQNPQYDYAQTAQAPIFDLLETGQITGAEFLKELHAAFPSYTEKNILDVWNSILLKLPSSRKNLIQLVAKNYRIFLLSNTNELHQLQFELDLKNEFGESLMDWFENVYYSHIVGFRKPNPEIFNLVLLENNLVSSETIFIEDTLQNIDGALKCGIPSLFLDVKNGDKIEHYFDDNGRLLLDKISSKIINI